MSVYIERAPAKVNLALHVLGRRADGYHDLESLVVFAGCGDLLSLEPEPGPDATLVVEGPSAAGAGPDADNLVLRAAREFIAEAPGSIAGRFRLTKRLPAAAGLGGGSSDAAAALRLLARANRMSLDDRRLFAAARRIGADVPVCLDPRAKIMRGVGDRLGPRLSLPPLFGVLVNPGVALETRAVFADMGLNPGDATDRAPGLHPPRNADADAVLGFLRAAGNDMESAARRLAPPVSRVLEALSALDGATLARMSGSGATCFGLFGTCRASARAARALRLAQPGWWVKATVLR